MDAFEIAHRKKIQSVKAGPNPGKREGESHCKSAGSKVKWHNVARICKIYDEFSIISMTSIELADEKICFDDWTATYS